MSTTEYQESSTITLEWTLKGLKNLFESSRGDAKSKVTKSVRFGGGKWQVLFYANAGGDGGFVSLYLSCEPTQDEKDNAMGGKWVRDGLYKFSFEIRSTSKTPISTQKEAADHSFSYKTANWGWAQFVRRDAVYFQSLTTRQADAFVIVCTISSSPSAIMPVNPAPKRHVPRELMDVIGTMLDNPLYSDVEFVLPKRGADGQKKRRTILANKAILQRAEYFRSMFNSGFSEMEPSALTRHGVPELSFSPLPGEDAESYIATQLIEDSDEEEERTELDFDEEDDRSVNAAVDQMTASLGLPQQEDKSPMDGSQTISENSGSKLEPDDGSVESFGDVEEESLGYLSSKAAKATEASFSRPATPIHVTERSETTATSGASQKPVAQSQPLPGPPKARVVVTDVAYTTYRAVLYYLYTDTIVFAPLSSSFLAHTTSTARPAFSRAQSQSFKPLAQGGDNGENGDPGSGPSKQRLGDSGNGENTALTRAEWIQNWASHNPDRPLPCSAKAVYKLADKLDLKDLKERASQHIIKSLTVVNVPHEVFSSFSAAFDDIRKVQIEFFLAHWSEIKGSSAMKHVWAQIRSGRHPGFEDVWPLITMNLEYKARMGENATGDEKEAAGNEAL